MRRIKIKEFLNNVYKYFDQVENKNDMLLITREKKEGVVLMSQSEYNSFMETLHLLSSKENSKRLFESIEQLKNGKTVQKEIKDF